MSMNTNMSMTNMHPSLLPSYLPKSFSPTAQEVVIGRGRKIQQHPGNVNLRAVVQSRAKDYVGNTDKTIKSTIISTIGRQIMAGSRFGGFVKKDTSRNLWYVVSDACIRATIAQAFRDCLSPSYKSSKFSKQRRRWSAKETQTQKTVPQVTSNTTAAEDTKPISFAAAKVTTTTTTADRPLSFISLQRDAAMHLSKNASTAFPDLLDQADCFRVTPPSAAHPSTTSDILKRCLDILIDDAGMDMAAICDENPFEPDPIPESPSALSSEPFLADDEHLWGLTFQA
ncbi:Nitrilase family, member 2 [Seminavis robusta]|uniref:Nitrilase family, member 2 n=1 Tax=Seminavis robusta TaxID=568900 RepID=A0A9N8HRT2_9STRA|nr:Nitrilase family, member 2 [Seminavis robusta]|eukprot:Sro1436_g272460.1 Nitrilase family, member 2 (284) ;mRNA; r:17626-18477